MDVREKLVNIVKRASYLCLPSNTQDFHINMFVTYLIAHGVTVQEWIPVDDKLPPYNRDVLVYRPNMAMKILVDNYGGYYGEDDDEWHEGWALYGEDAYGNPVITHWAYFTPPPKGE